MIAPPKYPLQADRRYPFYALVPKEFRANLRFRERLLRLGDEAPEYRAELWEMSRRDFLLWLNCFGWVGEPRNEDSLYRELPFISRPYQDRALDQLIEAIPKRDVTTFKSRDVGFSWMGMAKVAHDFLFSPMTEVGVVSAKEDLVDKSGAKSTLFAKIDFLLDEKRYPWWLLPNVPRMDGKRYRRNTLVFENVENNSSIKGFAATGDVMRSTRPTWAFMDEIAFFPDGQDLNAMSATQYATRCRVIGSTPNYQTGVFYERVVNREKFDAAFIEMSWDEDAEKAAGMYTSENGQLVLLDREFWARVFGCRVADVEKKAAEGGGKYRFIKDGKRRSPYFDYECARAENPDQTARELEKSFEGTGGAFFRMAVWKKIRERDARDPVLRGDFNVDVERYRATWEKFEDGPVLLWIQLDAHGKPPAGRGYVVGADIASGTAGTHSSNSVVAIYDVATGEQVAELATAVVDPFTLGVWTVAVCKLFNDALLNWDAKGVTGAQFTEAVRDSGYAHLYRKEQEGVVTRKKSRTIGSHVQGQEPKAAMLRALEKDCESGAWAIRSAAVYEELGQYVMKDGKLVHATSVTTTDHAARGDAHGDRVIASALARKARRDRPAVEPDPEKGPAPYGSLAWRMQQDAERELAAANNAYDWN